MEERTFPILELSLGNQVATNWMLRQTNEVERCINGVFHEEIGSIIRRKGYEKVETNTHSKPVIESFVANFDSGPVLFRALNNAAGDATVIQHKDGSSWVNLVTDLPVDTIVRMTLYRNEVFVGGYSPTEDEFIAPLNIDQELDVSEDRNLMNAPKAKKFVEFQGALWAVNVEIGTERYPDRLYESSPPTEVITTINRAVDDEVSEVSVGSVRYLKPGMTVNVYKALTDTLATGGEDIEILTVNRQENTFTFASRTVDFERTDEVWLNDGKGRRATLWNTDYPTRDTADWERLRSGVGANNDIVHAEESQNRMIIFTETSTIKFDGANMVPVKDRVGCISDKAVVNIDDSWLMWLDAKGRVQAHQEASGQSQAISRAIRPYLRDFPVSSLREATAIENEGRFKLSLQKDDESWRFVYDFDGNSWAIESHTRPIVSQFVFTEDDESSPYFFDDEGELFKDESSSLDDGVTIPLEIVLGDKNLMTEKRKSFKGAWVYSRKAVGTKVAVSVDFGQFIPVGEIRQPVQRINFPRNEKFKGDIMNMSFSNNTGGEGLSIDAIIIAYNTEENSINARRSV